MTGAKMDRPQIDKTLRYAIGSRQYCIPCFCALVAFGHRRALRQEIEPYLRKVASLQPPLGLRSPALANVLQLAWWHGVQSGADGVTTMLYSSRPVP